MKDLKGKVRHCIDEDLLDKYYNPVEVKKVRIVINGFNKFRGKQKKIYISPKEISKKKPFKSVCISDHDVSVYYLIFKEN